jgi:hypothetical protein
VSCDDGNVCNGDRELPRGRVRARARLSTCDDGLACSVDSCDPNEGCFSDASTCESCFDGIQNQGEAGVDCGGPCPDACPIATCTDGVQNQDETGVDCGGVSCDSCPNFPGTFDDFDVTADGKVVAVSGGWDGAVRGTCFAANGAVTKSFTIAQYAPNGVVYGTASVSTSRTTGGSIFAWYTGDWSFKELAVRIYDGNCDPVGPAFIATFLPSDYFVYDTVADDAGHFALLYPDVGNNPNANVYVRFYDGGGSEMGPALLVSASGPCHGHYGMQVSVNRTTGAGLVTCQRHFFDPVYYRRFNAQHQWIDARSWSSPRRTTATAPGT